MNALFKILIALAAAAFAVYIGVYAAIQNFADDVFQLHGRFFTQQHVVIGASILDLKTRKITYQNIVVTPDEQTPVSTVEINKIDVQLAPDFSPVFSSKSLFPGTIAIQGLTIEGVRIAYDVDSEGKNLTALRNNLSQQASTSSRQRLNAAVNDSTDMPQRYIFDHLIVKGIEVNARSQQRAIHQGTFPLTAIERTGVGASENGIAAPELLDTLSQQMNDALYKEAWLRGMIEPPKAITTDSSSRKKTRRQTEEAQEETTSSESDNSVKKTAKGVGQAFRSLGRGVKKLFTKEE
jgi:hypothetical protein